MQRIIKREEFTTKNHTINSKKAVMIGCGFVGSASIGEEALKLKKSAAALKKLQK